jgi:hypothetical protein
MTSLETLRELLILAGNQILAHTDKRGSSPELDDAMALMVKALDGLCVGLAIVELDLHQPTVQ